MIQRNFVWKPQQIIDLWDSLLQGMPIGSMMATELPPETFVRKPGKHEIIRVPAGGGLGLIDGQQRTLAMLAAWPLPGQVKNRDLRVWVDFADDPAPGHLLRLRITTKNQPFGFRRNEPSSKLSLDEKRKAREAFDALAEAQGPQTTADENRVNPDIDTAWPFSPTPGLPVDLRFLIGKWHEISRSSPWTVAMGDYLQGVDGVKYVGDRSTGRWQPLNVWAGLDDDAKDTIRKRVEVLSVALERLFVAQMPLVRVDERFFKPQGLANGDPPLAVLFKRIGTGGTQLSDADYVYSVIKHLRPETYDLVEELHGDGNVASLLTATEVVMSAVRLAATTWQPTDRKAVLDAESPSKKDFNHLLCRGDFVEEALLPLIASDGAGSALASLFSHVQAMLLCQGKSDIGLPKQAFPLLKRPLVQVLLYLAKVGYLGNGEDRTTREDVLRLVLFWLVAVTDPSKASRLAYEVVKERKQGGGYLGLAIHDRLVAHGAAVRLIEPDEIEMMRGLAYSPEGTTLLRGESRFDAKKQGAEHYHAVYAFYRRQWWRPWTHQHPILLWLQREMVASELDSAADPMAGKDEDTPYDYDHIVPSAHWANWQGRKKGTHPDRLLDFAEDTHLWTVGNSIGNVRVWTSSLNRSDGEASPKDKLKLDEDEGVRLPLLTQSAVQADQIAFWRMASGKSEMPRSWNEERTLAFQRAVEMRAFSLYQRYFVGLGFSSWSIGR